uniref:Retrovirus-related Pol polyprotein from transposon TNT 1-94 n=1 Tax=Cajanus cajan TaxID=3821 RepID=A0A151S0A2_CAJCA|nr:Retrovirus-related Pol polyprotein from transposon TNT 1-94 [Cajanus cajan]
MLIGVGEQIEGLHYLRRIVTTAAMKAKSETSYDLWHKRLGHASTKAINMLLVTGFVQNKESCNQFCDIFLREKKSRESFSISENKSMDIFQLIHCDLCGPYRTPIFCGARYFLTIVDDFSRVVWIYLLVNKKEVFHYLSQFITMVERQFAKQVTIVRSDNGIEFTSIRNYFLDRGIMHETSCIGTPQQNGRVERKHRYTLNVVRALHFQANFPLEFWGDCVLTASYLINRTSIVVLHAKTPYGFLYGTPLSLNHLCVLGCLCYAHNQNHKGDKFASRSRRCVLVAYPYGKKGWRLHDLELGTFFISKDVVFCEEQIPFSSSFSTDSSTTLVAAPSSLSFTKMLIDDDQPLGPPASTEMTPTSSPNATLPTVSSQSSPSLDAPLIITESSNIDYKGDLQLMMISKL